MSLSDAARAGLVAAAANIQAVLKEDDAQRALEQRAEKAAAMARSTTDPQSCTHPEKDQDGNDLRLAASAMGAPDRTICTACGTVLEGGT